MAEVGAYYLYKLNAISHQSKLVLAMIAKRNWPKILEQMAINTLPFGNKGDLFFLLLLLVLFFQV